MAECFDSAPMCEEGEFREHGFGTRLTRCGNMPGEPSRHACAQPSNHFPREAKVIEKRIRHTMLMIILKNWTYPDCLKENDWVNHGASAGEVTTRRDSLQNGRSKLYLWSGNKSKTSKELNSKKTKNLFLNGQ